MRLHRVVCVAAVVFFIPVWFGGAPSCKTVHLEVQGCCLSLTECCRPDNDACSLNKEKCDMDGTVYPGESSECEATGQGCSIGEAGRGRGETGCRPKGRKTEPADGSCCKQYEQETMNRKPSD